MIRLEDRRPVAVDDGGCRHPEDFLEEQNPPLDERVQARFGRVALQRHVADGLDLVAHDEVNLAEDPLHVGEEAKHRATADAGADGHGFGAGGEVAFAHKFDHRFDDATAAVLRATAAAVWFGAAHGRNTCKPTCSGGVAWLVGGGVPRGGEVVGRDVFDWHARILTDYSASVTIGP